jgi:ADP-ribosylation factor-like protein 6
MGIFRSKIEQNIICVGLDNSGKSTLLNYLKPPTERVQEVAVTVGFSTQRVAFENTTLTVFDMSGAGKYRNLWEHYYNDVKGIIFVIDGTDTVRMDVVKTELHTLLSHKGTNER